MASGGSGDIDGFLVLAFLNHRVGRGGRSIIWIPLCQDLILAGELIGILLFDWSIQLSPDLV